MHWDFWNQIVKPVLNSPKAKTASVVVICVAVMAALCMIIGTTLVVGFRL